MGREVQFQRHTIRTRRIEGGVHRPTGVDDEQVARVKEFSDLTELCVHNAVSRAIRDHQAHFIAGEPTRFWRFARFQFRW